MYKNFEEFNLNKDILKALYNLKYKNPTKVQSEVIPNFLKNKDVIVKSKTGSGKTASFAIPICQSVDINNNSVHGLIIVPTRELALQVKEEISSIGRLKKIRCSAIFGKQLMKDQINELKQRVHIVVATPGRIIDHISRGTINLDNIKYFVIDEADKMLNKGFIDDMETIIRKLPNSCVKGLFSATIEDNLNKICKNYMNEPLYIEIENGSNIEKKQIVEKYTKVERENRYNRLKELIYSECPDSLIVFANTKQNVIDLYNKMKKDKFSVGQIHGDMSQDKRLFTIKDFKEGKFDILVSTDVASRGIHIDGISLVINYEVPRDKENYVHRIGRTGRHNKFGKAITIVSDIEQKFLEEIELYTNNKLIEIDNINEEKINIGKIKLKQKNIRGTKKENKNNKIVDSEITKIYLNAGKKKKIRVVDIVGAFSNIDGINNEDIGVIEVQELCSYVDILNNKGSKLLRKYKEINIKKKLVKIKKDNKNI